MKKALLLLILVALAVSTFGYTFNTNNMGGSIGIFLHPANLLGQRILPHRVQINRPLECRSAGFHTDDALCRSDGLL
jgi:hypothetical protein